MGLGLLVVTIATSALLLGQTGFNAVDQTSMLRERQRLAVEILTRAVVQTAFEDFSAANPTFKSYASYTAKPQFEPDIYGWNNAIYSSPGTVVLSTVTAIASEDRPTKCGSVSDTSCKNGSDILVTRYQGVTKHNDATKSDNSMVSCGGIGEKGLTTNDLDDRSFSIFHVAVSNGEPALMCVYRKDDGAFSTSAPLIEGVESFQVLYGTDGVVPGTAPIVSALQNSVADRWLRADQLTVTGNANATRQNWMRVRAVRIGLVFRGPQNSAQQAVATTYRPLGEGFTNATQDVGSQLATAADARQRMEHTFTVHLRNDVTPRIRPQ